MKARMVCAALALATLRLPAEPAPPQWPLRLSEIETSGAKTYVEIENTGDAPESLRGYSLQVERLDSSDDRRGRFLYDFPFDVSIPAGDARFFVACFGGLPAEDANPTCGGDNCSDNLCLPFDIDQDGGAVKLFWRPACSQIERVLVDGVTYPPVPQDAVFARDTLHAEASWCIFEIKTPGGPNFLAPPRFQQCLEPSGRVFINEVASAGELDWVEILLVGDGTLHLGNYVLESKSESLDLPNVILGDPAGAGECDPRRAVIVLSRRGEIPPGACPERTFAVLTDLALSARGESVSLLPSSGPDWDRVTVPRLQEGEHFVRVPDGGAFVISRTATPSLANPVIDEKVAPDCEVIDRFPLRIHPGDGIEIYARVLDRDGQDDLDPARVDLLWSQGEGAEPRRVRMATGKRITCQRSEEPGIFLARIPADAGLSAGGADYWIEAWDRGGLRGVSTRESFFVQERDWQDPDGAQHLRINEVAANESDQTGDWVEIYYGPPDPNAPAISLSGMYLTEDVFVLDGRALHPVPGEDLYLSPGEFLLVTLGTLANPPGASLAFSLDRCRDELVLIHRDRKHVIDHVSFHEEKRNRSLGRVPDGGPDLSILPQTPGRSNRFDGQASCFRMLESVPGARPTVVINEVCADNWAAGADLGGEYGDWIELHNPGPDRVDLGCWQLNDLWSDDLNDLKPRKLWRFPPGTGIDAGQQLLVWCDNDDECETAPPDGELHTTFQLNRHTDFLQLLDPCGNVVDALAFAFQPRDVSVGRFPDGAGTGAFLEPSPGLPNTLLSPDRSRHFAPQLCLALPVHARIPGPSCAATLGFHRGRANADCSIDLADAVFTLAWLFLGGAAPGCQDAADSNDDGSLNLADAVFTLNYLFQGGAAPPRPGPEERGCDPTEDALDCGDPGCPP